MNPHLNGPHTQPFSLPTTYVTEITQASIELFMWSLDESCLNEQHVLCDQAGVARKWSLWALRIVTHLEEAFSPEIWFVSFWLGDQNFYETGFWGDCPQISIILSSLHLVHALSNKPQCRFHDRRKINPALFKNQWYQSTGSEEVCLFLLGWLMCQL